MNQDQLKRIREGKGFIAALDQSGGSTPKALRTYGIDETSYKSEAEMYDLVHTMRTRIITSPSFRSEYILGTILFRETALRQIDGLDTPDYLWQRKGIVPFLKIDEGLTELVDGVQLMKPISKLSEVLAGAKEKHIFGTKMRSVIKEYNPQGITQIVDQQFEIARQIMEAGLVPIIEPEVDIHSSDKQKIEELLRDLLLAKLDTLDSGQLVMLKLTLPSENDLYVPLIKHAQVIRVLALSGGYTREEANRLLAQNHGLIASFSRALIENLRAEQNDEEFNSTLLEAVEDIYQASLT